MTEILRLAAVTAGYGAGDILKGIDLTVEEGSVTCLIGPNGAGKSTVLKAVSGLLRPRTGRVLFRGEDLGRLSPRDRLLRGIVHVPQERSLFPAMTVRDNLLMGGYLIRDARLLAERVERAVAAFPICADRSHERAGSLSGGEQKLVELARSLVGDPALILLDEPSIGLAPKARRQVFDSVRRLAGSGRTILLVEQNARSGLAAADVGAVLEGGVVRLVAPADRLLTDPEVARLYLGAAAATTQTTTGTAASAEAGPGGTAPQTERSIR
jgi:branched-chain amino acid transport system ATP-binding protein